MELLIALLLLVCAGLALHCYRQSSRIGSLMQSLRNRDDELHRLNRQRHEVKSGDSDSEALASISSNIAFDLVLALDEERTIIALNRAAKLFFGDSNPVGETLQDLIDSPELHSLVEYASNETDSLEEQVEIDGAWYRARAQVIRFENRKFVGVALQDITELVNLNRARRELVANISHELRTPITRIRLIIEGLFLDADKPKRKASIQSLKEIAMETDALLWLAQELLDLSMIESGQAILRLVPTQLKQVVDESIDRFEAQAEVKDLAISSQVPPGLDILCDVDQLKRVLGNLIHNAIKWSPKAGAIIITALEVEDEVAISVVDDGPGVPQDLRNRVFERFYQADVSRSGDEGTGLGLAICKHIVEAHGGRIWAEDNSEGQGGQFTFTVLKSDASAQHERQSNGAEPAALSPEALSST